MVAVGSSTSTNTPKLIVADPTKGVKVDASVVAKSFRDEIKAKVVALKGEGIGTSSSRFSLP
jgi:hypothetical protein